MIGTASLSLVLQVGCPFTSPVKYCVPLPEANGVSPPAGGWDEGNAMAGVTEADRRELVKKIQALLADRGYDPGPADGVDGPKTRQAVRAFQHTIGIADTGEIDQGLVTALATPTQ